MQWHLGGPNGPFIVMKGPYVFLRRPISVKHKNILSQNRNLLGRKRAAFRTRGPFRSTKGPQADKGLPRSTQAIFGRRSVFLAIKRAFVGLKGPSQPNIVTFQASTGTSYAERGSFKSLKVPLRSTKGSRANTKSFQADGRPL